MAATTLILVRRTLLLVFTLFLLVASIGPKLTSADVATESFVGLGWSADLVVPIGLLELSCLVMVLVPRTRVLGALLMTAFLGGAVAVHVRVASPVFSHTLFGVYLGALMWAAILLEDPTLRRLVPLRRARV
jgi:hypothetical protein